MSRFLVCIHDATPAYSRETRLIIRDLAPIVGRRLCFGVVPDWHGGWPLAAHLEYCRMLHESSEELLLHGYLHRRHRGNGPVSWLTGGSDEMNGLDPEATRRTVERGQQDFARVFGQQARGFLAPAWQRGHVRQASATSLGIEYVLGFFTLDGRDGRSVPLATGTWDCGRWAWLGHIGHGFGTLLRQLDHRVPVLAIHPSDLARGFWPQIRRLTEQLIETGYQPTTPASLLDAAREPVHSESLLEAR